MDGLATPGLKSLPSDSRPREKLLARGPAALSDGELLALLLRRKQLRDGQAQPVDDEVLEMAATV